VCVQAHTNAVLDNKEDELAQLKRSLSEQGSALEEAQVGGGAIAGVCVCSLEIMQGKEEACLLTVHSTTGRGMLMHAHV